ncbi:Hypothetical predicted protein [Octopus vulgaris]|uniref:DEUBAD domain-containing protein n=1 Tax=Octopus vulgaris TaxID=6645 RepID=A0AA36BTV5_OCTVU|nr:Hypothetical predicted protein [Octopus vulgaris]
MHGIELSQVLKPDDIIPILANSEIQQHLLQYLPEGEMLPRTEEELRNTVQSPQFQQALQSFSAALRSRELGPLMTQFGLGDDVANAAAEGGFRCRRFADRRGSAQYLQWSLSGLLAVVWSPGVPQRS